MERPSALPPYSRVMEVSACVKLWNSRDSLSGAMPTPQIINPSGTRSSIARLESAGCDAALKAPLVLSPDAGRPASATRQVRTWRPPDRPAFPPWHTVRLEVQKSFRFKVHGEISRASGAGTVGWFPILAAPPSVASAVAPVRSETPAAGVRSAPSRLPVQCPPALPATA